MGRLKGCRFHERVDEIVRGVFKHHYIHRFRSDVSWDQKVRMAAPAMILSHSMCDYRRGLGC
jgi:hypothetical protein